MRLKLTFEQTKPNQLIPVNYQYYISSFIYKTIQQASSGHAQWLHDSAFSLGNKKFKLFTFSRLNLHRFALEKKYFRLLSETIELKVSLFLEETLTNFVKGLFLGSSMEIHGLGIKSFFSVKFIESIPEPEYTGEMTFKTDSPIFLSKKIDGISGAVYLKPGDEDYTEYFIRNLEEKYASYLSYCGKPSNGESVRYVQILTPAKLNGITIKEGTPEETNLKAYHYTFRISAPDDLLRLAYSAGFGSKNSMGFGYVEEERGFNKSRNEFSNSKKRFNN